MKARLYFLDNLRTFLILLVVVLHSGLVYESVLDNVWIVSDAAKNDSIGLIRMYLDLFVMFTIFFISGYFVPQSLKNKSNFEFIKSKFKRIYLPWVIAVLTLIPAYKVLFLYSRGLPQDEWFTYFHFFQRAGSDLSSFANNPVQNWLWFLPVLFIFQIAYLLLKRSGLLSIRISLKTGILLTFVVGILYSLVISELEMNGWFHSWLLHFQRERLVIYFLSFLLGSLCFKLKVFDNSLSKKPFIVSNVLLSLSLAAYTAFALNFFFNMIDPSRNNFFINEFADKIVIYVSAILSMLTFLHVLLFAFQKNFNRSSSFIAHLNYSSYSVYIIHTIVMGSIALLMMPVQIPAALKFVILTVLTYILSNALAVFYYQFIQKHVVLKSLLIVIFMAAIFSVTKIAGNEESQSMAMIELNHPDRLPVPEMGLHQAVLEGNIEIVNQHIQAGSDLDKKESTGGSSPLITAAVFGKTEIAIALIEAGADVNQKNNEGSTALHSATFFCRPHIVASLLANGADTSIRNNSGSTALESIKAPFNAVKPIYQYFEKALGPLGLQIDYEEIQNLRPDIEKMFNRV